MQFKTTFLLLLITLLSFSACQQQVKETVATKIAPAKKVIAEEPMPEGTTKTNWLRPPYKYWAIKNVDKLFPISTIAKGTQALALEKGTFDLTDLKIEQFDGKVYSFEEHLDSNRTDGFLVLNKGKIIYEKYFGNMTESSTHNWFSVSKSLTGLTAAVLAAEGKIDLQKPITHYIPELKGSAWDGPTVQNAMDMEVNIQFDEAYNNPKSDAYKFAKVSHFVEIPGPPSPYETVLDYFKTVKKGENHEELFHYVSLNTEIIGMIISKVTGKPAAKVMSEKVWTKMGAEQDGFIMTNPDGYELVSAAINSNIRDAGRLGLLMLNDGKVNGQQVIPESVAKTIQKGGSIEKFAQSKRGKVFKNFHYTNQWWHTNKAAFFAKGLFGQWIYVDPTTETVIVKFTTADIPTSTEYDWMNNMNLMEAIVERLGIE